MEFVTSGDMVSEYASSSILQNKILIIILYKKKYFLFFLQVQLILVLVFTMQCLGM